VPGKFWLLDSGFTFSVKENYNKICNKDFIGQFLSLIQKRIYSLGRGHAQKNLDINRF